nr:gliding motility-associated C-terminal domain-containing protein [Pontibacter harenae]
MAITASNDSLKHNEPLYVEARAEDLVSWHWDFGDGYTTSVPSPAHVYEYAGKYTVTLAATNKYGCSSFKTYNVIVAPHLFVPNIFTPNNDGKNDSFKVAYNGKGLFKVKIFDRWGKEIYQANSKDFEWTGNGSAGGNYFYFIKTETGTYRGAVTLSM